MFFIWVSFNVVKQCETEDIDRCSFVPSRVSEQNQQHHLFQTPENGRNGVILYEQTLMIKDECDVLIEYRELNEVFTYFPQSIATKNHEVFSLS